MKKLLLLAWLVVGSVLGSERYVAAGFLDHKTGISLAGYAITMKQTEKYEIFIGAGTMIAAFTVSAGWKYYFNNSPIKYYSVFSMQGINGMGGSFIAPVISLGVEKNFYKKWYINLGAISIIRPHPDKSIDLVTYPTININKRY